jgi:hypothetical protein
MNALQAAQKYSSALWRGFRMVEAADDHCSTKTQNLGCRTGMDVVGQAI